MEETTYKVYVQTDGDGNITAVNSSAFLPDTSGWTQIDEGTGDKYHHAQGNYFALPVMTNSGVYRYKLVDGTVTEKTDAEIDAEESALPEPEPSTETDLMSMAVDHEYRLTLLELGVTE